MSKNSKASLETSQDNIYMKQKNDQLIKEVVELKSCQQKLQSDLDYVMREKFEIERRAKHMERIFTEIALRSKMCGQKILEVVQELNDIFGLMTSTRNQGNDSDIMNSFKNITTTGIALVQVGSLEKEIINKSRNSENNSLKDKENIVGEADKKLDSTISFLSRGGSRISEGSDSLNNDSKTEENQDSQSTTTLTNWRLPTIEEDSENSSYNEKEVHGLTLPDISSTTFFSQLPKTNINTRRREPFSMNGSSFNVEVSSSMEKVDDSSLQDGNRSIKVTPGKPSQAKKEFSPKITPKSTSLTKTTPETLSPKKNVYIRRRKDYSNTAVDTSWKMENMFDETLQNESTTVTPRRSSHPTGKSPKTLTPKRISFIKRKSIGSPVPPCIERRYSNRRKSKIITTPRKSLESPGQLQISEESSTKSEKSPMLSLLPKESRRDIVKKSTFEETTLQENDSSYMVNWIENTSTPISLSREASSASMKPKNEKVSARRKDNIKDKLSQPKTKPSESVSKENQMDHSSVEADVSDEITRLEKDSPERQFDSTSKSTKEKKTSEITNKEKDSDVEGSLALEKKVSSLGESKAKQKISNKKKSSTTFSSQCSEENKSSFVETETLRQSLRARSPKKRDTLRRTCMNNSYNPVEVYIQAVKREQQWSAENRRKKTMKNMESSKDSSLDDCENKKTPSKKQESPKEEKTELLNKQNHEMNSDCENPTKSSTSAKRSRKRRADVLTDRDENVPKVDGEEQEGFTTRKKRAVKKVEYKEPSLIVKLRRT